MNVLDLIDRVLRGRVREHFREAATAYDNDPNATDYRRLTGTVRDLDPLKFDEAMKLSFTLWQRNPLARRMIDILLDFSTGDEFAVKVLIKRRTKDGADVDTKRTDAQKIWDDFYAHPVNQLKRELRILIQDLLLNGELALPMTVNRKTNTDQTISGDGTVQIGFIDPLNIREVLVDPKNIRSVQALKVAPPNSANVQTVSVITHVQDPHSDEYGRLSGEVLYWRLNRVSNQTRGHGFLVDLLDWLDALDQFLFDALTGFRVRNSFLWQVVYEGLSEEELEKKKKEITPPKSGTVRITNEKVHYTAVAPSLGAAETDRALLSFETFVVGNKGFPIHWFGTGSDVNRATAAEMGVPVMRMLKAQQQQIKWFMEFLVQYVSDQAVLAKSLRLGVDEYVEAEISMFDFERADAAVLGAGFTQVVTALQAAQQEGWVSAIDAKRVIDGLIRRMGVAVDASIEPDDLKAEQEQKSQEEVYRRTGPPAEPESEDELAPPRESDDRDRPRKIKRRMRDAAPAGPDVHLTMKDPVFNMEVQEVEPPQVTVHVPVQAPPHVTVNVPEQKTPIVNVTVSEQQVTVVSPPVKVDVNVPDIIVPAAEVTVNVPAPIVNVENTIERKPMKVHRDRHGNITEVE